MWKFLRVNMTNRTASSEDAPEKYKYMAGRWLTSALTADEVPALAHPLGPNNKIIFSPGIITGTPGPTSARISVGGKSPLTGGIKESNAGTGWGQQVARLGYKAVIVEGFPAQNGANGKFWGRRSHWIFHKQPLPGPERCEWQVLGLARHPGWC